MAKHKAAKKRRVVMAGAATVASVGMVLAGTSASAIGITEPGPKDCISLVQALVSAQVDKDGKSAELDKAEKADTDAKAVHDRTKTDAQMAYNDAQPYKGAIDPNIEDDTQEAADERVRQAAEYERDRVIAAAEQAYDKGDTAEALKRAQAAEGDASRVLAEVRLDIGKMCSTPAPPERQDRTPEAAPVPTPVEADLPVTH